MLVYTYYKFFVKPPVINKRKCHLDIMRRCYQLVSLKLLEERYM
jgi:hypothetical protein